MVRSNVLLVRFDKLGQGSLNPMCKFDDASSLASKNQPNNYFQTVYVTSSPDSNNLLSGVELIVEWSTGRIRSVADLNSPSPWRDT